jgi:xylan 1,4-beta-xylosidase
MDTPLKRDAGARAEWEERIGKRSNIDAESQGQHAAVALPPPDGLVADPGVGQVTLRWRPVAGAVGYLAQRGESPDGPFAPVNNGGGDVIPVPGPPYADTTGSPGTRYWYTVASLSDVKAPPGALSTPVAAQSESGTPEPLKLSVKAQTSAGQIHPAWRMLGSEHLSQLFYAEGPGGNNIGEEFAEALRIARDELGATHIRAHAILNDEQHVYREVNGVAEYDFTGIDRIYDRLLDIGLRPVVELSFMPRDLASSPEATVFTYGGIISPPRDWNRWGELNHHLAAHLVKRYGIKEVSQWGFEVWNEANLKVFWTGTQEEYFRLYEIAARAIKSVDERLLVGGPSSAAAEWVVDLLDFVRRKQLPLDFVSTHTYGNLPLDIGQALKTYGFEDVKIWWTEWGVSPTHFAAVVDEAFGAPFVLHGMKSIQGRADALAYWVISDHFEELGRPPKLLHGGFGLLTVGNLRKPRFWALALLQDMGTNLIQLDLQGDGAGSLVDAWASHKPGGSIDILAWNGTLDQSKIQGSLLLNRHLDITIEQLEDRTYHCSLARVDANHSNIAAHWQSDQDWPTPEQWKQLHTIDKLDEQSLPDVKPVDGVARLDLELPMPGVIRLRLTPHR